VAARVVEVGGAIDASELEIFQNKMISSSLGFVYKTYFK
jgi:hypothetical protein